jgi:ribosomal-protein-alanine N-acetyltransferase
MQIRIRPMRLADIDEVMEIEPVAFGSHHWSHQSFVNELNNSVGTYFAAMDDVTKRLCGYSGFWLVNQGQEAHITTLAVHPDLRRQYVGERLLIHDILEAKRLGVRWITLEVRVSNESAQRLYYKYGFKSAGLRPNYYQDNDEDAMILWTENIESLEFIEVFKRRVAELTELMKHSGLTLEGAELPHEGRGSNRANGKLLNGTNGNPGAENHEKREEHAKFGD